MYRAECFDCGYSYKDERLHFVKTGAENHETVCRNLPNDHKTTIVEVKE